MRRAQGSSPLVLGIDPAPKKKAAIWSEVGLRRVPPRELRTFLTDLLTGSRGVIVVWDSPLAFDPSYGFSDRCIDRAARSWMIVNVRAGLIEAGAVAVRPFSGCPHWVFSCHVLGLPFGEKINGLSLYSSKAWKPKAGNGFVIEVHPAVALAALWIDMQIETPFPRYKGSGAQQTPALIAATLGFPSEAGENDDALDAFVAYHLGTQLLAGEASLVGDPCRGGYLLPRTSGAEEIARKFGL